MDPPRARPFGSLRSRNVRLFLGGQSVSLVGTWIQQVAMGWLAYRLTGSPLLLGVLAAAGQLPSLLLMPIAGGLSDRWSRHRILIITQSLAMGLTLVLAALALAGVVAVWHLVTIGALLGVVGALDVPARQAFVADMVESREDVGNAVALHASVTNAARLIGPSIGGAIVARAGEGVCFLVNGASYAAVLAALVAMRTVPEAPPRPATPILAGLRATARYARSTPPIAKILVLVALVTLLGRPYTVLLPVFAAEVLHGGPQTLGWLMAASGCGALVGTLALSGRRSLDRSATTIAFGAAVAGAALVLRPGGLARVRPPPQRRTTPGVGVTPLWAPASPAQAIMGEASGGAVEAPSDCVATLSPGAPSARAPRGAARCVPGRRSPRRSRSRAPARSWSCRARRGPSGTLASRPRAPRRREPRPS